MKRSTAAFLLVMATLGLVGCGSDETKSAGSSTTVAATTTATATVTVTASPESAESSPSSDEVDTDPSVEEFGETIEFDNGLTVSISRPKPFQPSGQADYDGFPL